MTREMRPVTDEEWPAFVRTVHTAFGSLPAPEHTAPELRSWPLDRSIAVIDDGEIIAGAGAFTFEITLPGLTSVPAAGVTWVAVLPTHTRQGILRSMMQHQLGDIRERGESLAVLLASESLIYGRFGYGLATTHADYELDRRHASLAVDIDAPGRVVLVDPETARKVLPEVHERVRRTLPGEVTRPEGWWEGFFRENKPSGGAGARFFAVHESPGGEADGYVYYRVRTQGVGAWEAAVEVGGLGALTDAAYTALWRYVADIDLSWKVVAKSRPVDEPLRWMLEDPRRLTAKNTADFLWVRLVDLAPALAARRYATSDRVVVDVTDEMCPSNTGRWAVEGGPDGASCERTSLDADLVCSVADLGAAYLGGVTFSTLARAGRVRGDADALRRADRFFSGDRAPWCGTAF